MVFGLEIAAQNGKIAGAFFIAALHRNLVAEIAIFLVPVTLSSQTKRSALVWGTLCWMSLCRHSRGPRELHTWVSGERKKSHELFNT